jgi:hypothetical protein
MKPWVSRGEIKETPYRGKGDISQREAKGKF